MSDQEGGFAGMNFEMNFPQPFKAQLLPLFTLCNASKPTSLITYHSVPRHQELSRSTTTSDTRNVVVLGQLGEFLVKFADPIPATQTVTLEYINMISINDSPLRPVVYL
jgi:hypothetical protein